LATAYDPEVLEYLHLNPRVRAVMLAFDEGEAKHALDVCETCLEMRISSHDSKGDIEKCPRPAPPLPADEGVAVHRGARPREH
jgi:hypothetical protein